MPQKKRQHPGATEQTNTKTKNLPSNKESVAKQRRIDTNNSQHGSEDIRSPFQVLSSMLELKNSFENAHTHASRERNSSSASDGNSIQDEDRASLLTDLSDICPLINSINSPLSKLIDLPKIHTTSNDENNSTDQEGSNDNINHENLIVSRISLQAKKKIHQHRNGSCCDVCKYDEEYIDKVKCLSDVPIATERTIDSIRQLAQGKKKQPHPRMKVRGARRGSKKNTSTSTSSKETPTKSNESSSKKVTPTKNIIVNCADVFRRMMSSRSSVGSKDIQSDSIQVTLSSESETEDDTWSTTGLPDDTMSNLDDCLSLEPINNSLTISTSDTNETIPTNHTNETNDYDSGLPQSTDADTDHLDNDMSTASNIEICSASSTTAASNTATSQSVFVPLITPVLKPVCESESFLGYVSESSHQSSDEASTQITDPVARLKTISSVLEATENAQLGMIRTVDKTVQTDSLVSSHDSTENGTDLNQQKVLVAYISTQTDDVNIPKISITTQTIHSANSYEDRSSQTSLSSLQNSTKAIQTVATMPQVKSSSSQTLYDKPMCVDNVSQTPLPRIKNSSFQTEKQCNTQRTSSCQTEHSNINSTSIATQVGNPVINNVTKSNQTDAINNNNNNASCQTESVYNETVDTRRNCHCEGLATNDNSNILSQTLSYRDYCNGQYMNQYGGNTSYHSNTLPQSSNQHYLHMNHTDNLTSTPFHDHERPQRLISSRFNNENDLMSFQRKLLDLEKENMKLNEENKKVIKDKEMLDEKCKLLETKVKSLDSTITLQRNLSMIIKCACDNFLTLDNNSTK